MKKGEETYTLTFKGLIHSVTVNEDLTKKLIDSIELYLRRHYSKDGHPGIVLNMNTGKFEFVTLEKEEIQE